jgi:hypothetical protein
LNLNTGLLANPTGSLKAHNLHHKIQFRVCEYTIMMFNDLSWTLMISRLANTMINLLLHLNIQVQCLREYIVSNDLPHILMISRLANIMINLLHLNIQVQCLRKYIVSNDLPHILMISRLGPVMIHIRTGEYIFILICQTVNRY